jgi:hypothetical protein
MYAAVGRAESGAADVGLQGALLEALSLTLQFWSFLATESVITATIENFHHSPIVDEQLATSSQWKARHCNCVQDALGALRF